MISINNAELSSDGGTTNDGTDDYFGMEIAYNTTESSLGNPALYDGNISAVKWKGLGSITGNEDRRSYKFAYDKAHRLLTATSQMYSGSTWTKEANVKNESMTYDDNGNIKTLQRNQPKHQLQGIVASYISEPIDNLTFTYKATNGNQLDHVEDATGKSEGFSNLVTGNNEFTYNADGSVSADDNKGIDTIYHNILGKPWQIVFTDGRKLEYTYGASGQKLKMKFYQSGVVQDSTDYFGSFVYKKGALEFFASSEGRVIKNGSNFEYQYVISDHQGNTRVLFSSVTPAAESAGTDFETDPGGVENFPTGGNLNSLPLYNNTPGGTNSQLLNGGYNGQVGVGKSFAVFPGDTVRIEAYAKYEGSNSSSPGAFASALLAAFGLPAPGPGETGTASSAMNTWGVLVDGGYQDEQHTTAPGAYVNIIIFDKNFDFLDAAYQQISTAAEQVGVSPDIDHENVMKEYIIEEQGYVFMYVSNNSPVNVYFDDVTMTHSANNVIQYNEYYPFGLQTASSWTRPNASNRYLYNGGNELNENSGWYETFFREYDAALGRFMQVDPLAGSFASGSPYLYAHNNPLLYNDVLGDSSERFGPASGNYWSNQYNSAAANYMMMSTGEFRSYYGLDDGRGGTNYAAAGDVAESLASSGLGVTFTFEWNPYGGDQISRREWLELGGDPNKSADLYFSGGWQDSNRDNEFHLFNFQDEKYALQYMLIAQELYQKEIFAYVVDGPTGCGILVLPWAGNNRTSSDGWTFYHKGTQTVTDRNNVRYKAFLTIHTHPDDGGIDVPYRPSSDDIENTTLRNIPGIILAPNNYILINTGLGPKAHFINSSNGGSTQDLLKGNDSLGRFIK